MFALRPRVKVLVKLFQKLAGLGRAHKTAFLFAKPFSLRLLCQRKSGIENLAGDNPANNIILFFCKKQFQSLLAALHAPITGGTVSKESGALVFLIKSS